MHTSTFPALFVVFVLATDIVLAGAPHNDPVWNKRRHTRISASDDAVVDALLVDGRESTDNRLTLSHNATGVETRDLHSFDKRFSGGRFTYYEVGLGACGGRNSDSDHVVALNIVQWANRAHCGKQITITANGKTAQATIVDLCPGCAFGSLDLSPSLFQVFAPHSQGEILDGSWEFGEGTPPATTSTRPPSSTRTGTPSTTSSSTSSSTSASAPTTTSASAIVPSSTPAGCQVHVDGNLQQLMIAIGQFSGVVIAGLDG